MPLSSPAITQNNVRGSLKALLAEFLSGYFNGASHAIGGAGTVKFPTAVIVFDQSALPQPLQTADNPDGCAITLVGADPGRMRQYLQTGGKRVFEDVTWQCWVRAKTKETGTGNSESKCETASNLLFALLNNATAWHPLSQKGVSHLRPGAPTVVMSLDYNTRILSLRMRLVYSVTK